MFTHPQTCWKILSLAALAGTALWGMHRLVSATTLASPALPAQEISETSTPVLPASFLQRWCYDCHGDGSAKGDFAMDGPEPLAASDWDKIRRHVLLRTMPPEDRPAPSAAAREAFEQDLLAWQATLPAPHPPSPFRRLSRREFANSLADLTGIAPAIAELPEEESTHGFDNNGAFQPLPASALERYVRVIRETLALAFLPAPAPARSRRWMASEFLGPGGPSPEAPLFYETESDQPTHVPASIATAGRYRLTLKAYAHQAGDLPVQASLMDTAAQSIRSTQRRKLDTVSALIDLPAGLTELTFRLANPYEDLTNENPHLRTRRLLAAELILEGPVTGDTAPTDSLIQHFGVPPEAHAPVAARVAWLADAIDRFASRAWRRPLSPAESHRLLSFGGQAMAMGLRPAEALVTTLEAVLMSPHFLFLPDPSHAPPANRAYAIAARLSHLLWSTLPDETLIAESATPWTAIRLTTSALRLLQDPRAAALGRDFAGQWLQLRNTVLSTPDASLFPDATPARRAEWQHQAEAFFLDLIRENQPVLHLLGGQNQPTLARFDDATSLLRQPAVLLLTSYPNRTSPVLRGKYILENLLGLSPPPPPPNIPTLTTAAPLGHAPPTIRAALEQHRADRACAACHRAIDPLGFPLEAFDAIGRPTGFLTADLTATTFTGTTLHSPSDLETWLVQDQGLRIVNHTAERLLTYALGHGLSAAEIQTAHRLVKDCGGRGARFRDLLLAVITSPLFRGAEIRSQN